MADELKSYVAGGSPFANYPGAGDPLPPKGAKVLLLTEGGVCVVGPWASEGYVAWHPLPPRDREKEAKL